MKILLDCKLCKIYIILPLKQFEDHTNEGGLFLDDLKCISCGNKFDSVDLSWTK